MTTDGGTTNGSTTNGRTTPDGPGAGRSGDPAQGAPAGGATSEERPDPRLNTAQKVFLWGSGGCALLLLLCGGVSSLLLQGIMSATVPTLAQMRATEDEESRRRVETTYLLESVAARLELLPELPVDLPEQPPPDAWKNGIRWRRSDAHRGVLTSAGPDGDFRTTEDNLEIEVRTDR